MRGLIPPTPMQVTHFSDFAKQIRDFCGASCRRTPSRLRRAGLYRPGRARPAHLHPTVKLVNGRSPCRISSGSALPNFPHWTALAAGQLEARGPRGLGRRHRRANVLMRLNYYGFSVENRRLSPESSPCRVSSGSSPAELSSPSESALADGQLRTGDASTIARFALAHVRRLCSNRHRGREDK
jgi:hypothetical protein